MAQAHIREIESGKGASAEHHPAPSATDFDALRGAAERLRVRTEQLVQAAGTPAQEAARAAAEQAEHAEVDEQAADHARHEATEQARVEAARLAVEASLAEEEAEAARRVADEAAASTVLPEQTISGEPFGKPGILRVFPGAAFSSGADDEFDVESELRLDEAMPRHAIAQHAVPTLSQPGPKSAGRSDDRGDADHAPAGPAGAAGVGVDEPTGAEAPQPRPTPMRRTEPIVVKPCLARKRSGFLRRRRIDARKLKGVDAEAALRAMVSAIDDLWTAGNPLDLVVALTDGSALHISGGDRVPLAVAGVEPGTPARTTVTATTAQVVPLFGRLELTSEQSAPLIHGSRRDADLLVGWIDRAQRLAAEPL